MKEPKIRFKGFSGEWKETTLANVGKCFSGIGFPETEQGRKKGIPFYKVSDMNNIGNEKVMSNSNNYVTEEQVNKNGWKVCNDVPAIYFAKVGAAVLLNRKRLVLKPCLCDNNTMLYSFDKKVWDTYFCQSYFETIDLSSLVQVGSLPSYNASMVGEVNVSLPDIDEQKALGAYFQHLDSLIQSTTKKIESLKQVKAASLQSMFPQEGETTPRVRFKGFEEEWEKVKIQDICSKANSTHSENSLGENIGNYPIFGANGYLQNITTFDFSFPYIGIIKDGSGVGRSQLYPAFSSILGTMQYILPKGDINISFLAYLFETIDFSMYINGSSIPHIYFKDYCEQDEYIPSIAEQRAIASYFTTLDRQITLQNQRLEKLKQIKAACLDKMFV